jgi:putative aldouronate transport system permease protein
MKNKLRKMFFADGLSGLILDIIIYITMLFVLVVTLYPFLNILAVSFNDAMDTIRGTVRIWPNVPTLHNYRDLLERDDANILHSTWISIARTVVGCVLSVTACMMLAYTLSRKEFFMRFVFLKMLVFTMYFSGGLIPVFLLMRELNLAGTFWIYVIPGMINAFNVVVIRSFIESSVPDSLIESARIDGATEFRTLFKIVFPLALPVVATVTLWTAVGQWNSWFDVMLYNNRNPELYTLQYELQVMLHRSMSVSTIVDYTQISNITTTPQATRAAMTIIATVPILMVYPFLQRYFIHGLTIGGVKE